MKVLVLSDSHAGLSFMRCCIEKVKPGCVIHLGDYFDDGKVLAEEYPHIPFHQVPGNCDRYRCPPWQAEILCYPIGGVKLLMTHGHKHAVKTGTQRLLEDARDRGVQAVLYGHTHRAECYCEPDGLWVLNPGSCGSYSGSVGVMELENGKISACYILSQTEISQLF